MNAFVWFALKITCQCGNAAAAILRRLEVWRSRPIRVINAPHGVAYPNTQPCLTWIMRENR